MALGEKSLSEHCEDLLACLASPKLPCVVFCSVKDELIKIFFIEKLFNVLAILSCIFMPEQHDSHPEQTFNTESLTFNASAEGYKQYRFLKYSLR